MPRHVHDDFSFLPSVDSTEDEVIERRAVWEAKKEMLAPGAVEQEAAVPVYEVPPTPEVVHPVDEVVIEERRAPEVQPPERDSLDQASKQSAESESKVIGEPPAKERKAIVTSSVEASSRHEKEPQQPPKPFHAPKPIAPESDDPETAKRKRWQRLAEKIGVRSLGWSVGVHLFLLLIAAFIGIRQVVDHQIDFLPGGSSAQAQAAADELHNQVQVKKNPWMKARPLARKLTVQSLVSEIVLPEMPPMDMMDFSKITNRMTVSSAALGAGQPLGMGGAGGGFGAGIGRGGRFSFVGQTAMGRHVVFVVDVSGSMSAIAPGESISRFDLLKKELVKTMNQMPMGTSYQILYFSDFAWPHDQVDSRNSEALLKYKWEIDSKDYKKVKIPSFKYIQANPFSLRESTEIIQRSENPGGTNWGSGLLMALKGNPKPDVIFFMTDGLRSDEQGWVDVVTAENKSRLPVTAIYTSAMQEPDAAPELDSLARRNNGRFTIVLGDGKVVKGEDYFKGKR